MNIRKASCADIGQIHELDKESVKYHLKFDKEFYQVSARWWKIKCDSQLKAMQNPSDLLLVAEENGKIIGYIWGYTEKMIKFDIGKIQELVVSAAHRRKGVAKKLIKGILEFFASKKCIVSETTVNAKNESAVKTYESAGFEKVEYKMRFRLDRSRRFSPLL